METNQRKLLQTNRFDNRERPSPGTEHLSWAVRQEASEEALVLKRAGGGCASGPSRVLHRSVEQIGRLRDDLVP